MEDLCNSHKLDSISNAVRKKRTQTSRRPRPDSQPYTELHEQSPLSSTTPSDDQSKVSSDENAGCDANSWRKGFNLNECVARAASVSGNEEKPHKNDSKDGGSNVFYNNEPGRNGINNKRSSEGVLAPANWKSTSILKDDFISESRNGDAFNGYNGESPNTRLPGLDGFGNDSKVKKVKLKVGGVTRTIQANSAANGTAVGGSLSKTSRLTDVAKPLQKQNFLGNSDNNQSPSDKKRGLKGIPWKDFSTSGVSIGRDSSTMGKITGKNPSGKEGDRSEPVRKSKRVPKRRVLDGGFGDDEEDDEIRYLEKLKISKVTAGYRDDDDDDEEPSKKLRKLSAVSKIDSAGAPRSGKDLKKKSRTDGVSGDTDYEVEEDSLSDGELEGKKKQKKEPADSLMDGRKEMTLTTRQRALQSGRDATGSTLIEFPNGLPPAASRKQKEKLSDVEQQLKKAEAAQRRRMQVEKAAKESEEEAIRKILGQDSTRKKREDKIKKRQQEMAQEKAANALTLPPNTVRVVMAPTGTVVTFSNDMGLPKIFDSKPCSYPPPRENCASPSCTNPYKYRDSKSKLPLCSLKCYKTIQEKMKAETTN